MVYLYISEYNNSVIPIEKTINIVVVPKRSYPYIC